MQGPRKEGKKALCILGSLFDHVSIIICFISPLLQGCRSHMPGMGRGLDCDLPGLRHPLGSPIDFSPWAKGTKVTFNLILFPTHHCGPRSPPLKYLTACFIPGALLLLPAHWLGCSVSSKSVQISQPGLSWESTPCP